ncbi:bile acid:sodium symporter family protein [Nakamurella deserti]|uniref:bile acid:sodium symporter family protein n=1 Tax=Nakamurella deserti TaxID=2164074 RepID=UPI000DBE71CE|nr:bile acid:sodium symporter family protein [Nakamurella deserti]
MTTVLLPIALGIVMFGLGLTLTPADFTRIGRHPRAVFVALVCQLVLLPAVCFGLVLLFGLPPVLAVGMMLLAASPGGTTANLFSHLFRADVALNISLTAINSLISVVTLPLVVNLSLRWFDTGDPTLGLQLGKTLEVFAIVLLPVAAGMLVRARSAAIAARAEKPVRIASLVILVLVVAGTIVSNAELLAENVGRLAGITAVFCGVSLAVGFAVPRMFAVERRQALAAAFEIGMHNATLAVVIAQSVLDNVEMSLPAGVYAVLMFFFAAGFGMLVRDRRRVRPPTADVR